ARLGKTGDAQDIARTLLIDIVTRLQIVERIEGSGITWFVPDLPHGAIFTTQSPENEGSDAELASSAKLIQQGNAVKKPDNMACMGVLVDVLEVRIECVVVEIEIGIHVACKLPDIGYVRMLIGVDDVRFAQLGVARLGIGDGHFPVVTVIAHGADDLA